MTKLIQGKPSCKIKIIFFVLCLFLSECVCLSAFFSLPVCVSFNFYGISLCFIVLFFSTLQFFFFFLSCFSLSLKSEITNIGACLKRRPLLVSEQKNQFLRSDDDDLQDYNSQCELHFGFGLTS